MNPILFPAPLKIRATYIKIVENKQNVHYLWCHDFLNFDDIFKNDRVRGGLQSVKIKKPPGISCNLIFSMYWYNRSNQSREDQTPDVQQLPAHYMHQSVGFKRRTFPVATVYYYYYTDFF